MLREICDMLVFALSIADHRYHQNVLKKGTLDTLILNHFKDKLFVF